MRRPLYALVAAALVGAIALPIAFAGAASRPQPKASAGIQQQVKKLTRQVNRLRLQLADLAPQPGPAGPPGPAGADGPAGPAIGPAAGDLTGSYPNPLIAPGAVTGAKIATNQIGVDHLRNQSVRASELGLMHVVRGGGAQVLDTRRSVTDTASCPAGEVLIGGGHDWRLNSPTTSIVSSHPESSTRGVIWVVTGRDSAFNNELIAVAYCMER